MKSLVSEEGERILQAREEEEVEKVSDAKPPKTGVICTAQQAQKGIEINEA